MTKLCGSFTSRCFSFSCFLTSSVSKPRLPVSLPDLVIQFIAKNYGFLILAFVGFMTWKASQQGEQRNENPRYTIGTIYGTRWAVKSGKYAQATYEVNGIKYKTDADADDLSGRQLIGRKFLVEFYELDPGINALYLDVEVPHDVSAPPREGWEIPPFSVPSRIIKKP